MRRWLSLALLFALGCGPVAPLFAIAGDADQLLPLCCRRNGAHKCGMPDEAASGDTQRAIFRVRCAALPSPARTSPTHTMSGPQFAPEHAGLISKPSPQHEAESWARIAREGARQKRGPPPATLG